jgi:4-amino-4-deoxy-L-arabinose transferase-like glycosyltransferase
MSSDATTLRLRDAPPAGAPAAPTRRDARERTTEALARRHARIGTGALIVLVVCSLLFVLIAANRPSLFAAPTHTGFFPGWMAGPLGGLWPGLTRDGTALRWLFTAGMVVMYGCYLLALTYVPRVPRSARWAIAAIVAAHVIFFLAPPMALTDIFNYINYGRMEVVHHLNPYTTFPILEPHSDPSYPLSNWHELLSPYGPLFTLLTFALVPLGVATSFWAIKAVLMAASLGLIALVWKCARMLDLDPVRAIVLVGLNPIVLVWGLGGDHNDFLTVFAIVLGFYLLLRTRERERSGDAEIGAGAAFVAATALKASAGILIPIVLVSLLRTPKRLVRVLLGMVAAGLVVGAASLIAFGLHIPDLSTQSELVTNISIPNLIGLGLGSGGETETLHDVLSLALVATVIWSCVMVWRRRWDVLTASGWATVALLVTLGWVLPWYILWLLPLAALSRARSLRTTALVLGAYLIIAWAPASGLIWTAIHFHPDKTPLGRLHQRYVKELLN